MAIEKIYKRADGSRVKITPVLEMDKFDNEAFEWSYRIYYCAPGEEKFEDVSAEHIEGPAFATHREISQAQFELWEAFKPSIND